MRVWPSDRVGKAKRDVCVWRQNSDGYWIGACCIIWNLGAWTPTSSQMNFFPHRGQKLEQKGGADERD